RRRELPFAGDEVAEGRGLVGGQHATGNGGLKIGLAIHGVRLPWPPILARVCWLYNTVICEQRREQKGAAQRDRPLFQRNQAAIRRPCPRRPPRGSPESGWPAGRRAHPRLGGFASRRSRARP